jgi:glycolate oxidase iron-sulfur subunit
LRYPISGQAQTEERGMETHFSPEQLKDPGLSEAEAILRRCVHCGLCNPACPTYTLSGDERDGPRGRIYLIKGMFESEAFAPDTAQAKSYAQGVRPHLDRCLTCLSCASACPSGVDYGKLVDLARAHIETKAKRPLRQRLARRIISAVIPHASRFHLALIAAPFVRPFRGVLRAMGFHELAAMLEQAPASPFRAKAPTRPAPPPVARRKARVVLHWGCAQPVLRPEIHEAAIRLLTSQGVEVVLPAGEGCCGALDFHMGRKEAAKAAARRNIDAWETAHIEGRLDAIIIDAAGCGAMIKDYADLLADDPAYSVRAKAVTGLAKDICEFLASHEMRAPEGWSDIRVAYHSACALQHGQRVHDEPVRLLRQSGFTVVEIPEGHMCCGSAGSYSLLQPAASKRLLERKLANIASAEPDCVAAGNIGCIEQMSVRGAPPIVHTIQLIDWAHGGPCPEPLRRLERRMRTMQAFIPSRTGGAPEEAKPGRSKKKGSVKRASAKESAEVR